MIQDLGWEEDSSGHPMYDSGWKGREEKPGVGVVRIAGGTLWINREERRRHSRWRVICIKARRQDFQENSKQAHLAGTAGRSRSLVKSEAGKAGKAWSWSGLTARNQSPRRQKSSLVSVSGQEIGTLPQNIIQPRAPVQERPGNLGIGDSEISSNETGDLKVGLGAEESPRAAVTIFKI